MEVDYKKYRFSRREWIFFLCKYIGLLCFVSYLFFDNLWMAIVLSPLLLVFAREEIERKNKNRLAQLAMEFKEFIMSISGGLNAGYSVENSIRNARKEIEIIYPDKNLIGNEINIMINGIENNIPIQAMMGSFARRSGLEEVENFAEVLTLSKQSGGNLIKIIGKSAESISQKIEVKEEIVTTIASKKLEQKIMSVMPFLIVLYIRVSNGEYIGALYHNPIGMGIMTVCLVLTIFTNRWAKKIVSIEV